jgi:hypothetical protein
MSTLGRTRLRVAADAASFDAPLDVLRRATPQFWRGNDVQFEIAVFFNGALLDVSNLASLTLEIRPLGANGHAPDPSFAPLMGATVTSFDNTTTLDNWNAGTNQQALVVFTAAQSNIAAGAAWLSIFAITNDSPGRLITLCAGPVRVLEDGAGLATTPTPAADTFYTAAESDARFAPIGAGSGAAGSNSNPLMDGTAAPGTSTPYARADHVHPSDTSRAPLASPALTGMPTAPTVGSASDSSTKLATTAFVQAAIAAAGSGGGGTWGSITGTLSSQTDLAAALAALAPLASPALTGAPAAPTAAVDTNTTQLATTAFVLAQASGSGDGTPAMDGTAARGASTHWARADHVHPTDTTRAPLASPSFSGTPTAPTVGSASDSSTKLATTAFVQEALVAYTAPIASDGSGHYIFGGGSAYAYPGPSYAVLTVNGPFAVRDTFETAFVNDTAPGVAETPWNVNTISIQTTDANRDTAIRIIGDDGYEDGAMGRGNSTAGNPWGLYTFLSTSPGYDLTTGAAHNTTPGGIALVWEGTYNGEAEQYYRRMEINPNASVNFHYPPAHQGRGFGNSPQLSLNGPAETGASACTLFNYNTDALAAAQYYATALDGTNATLAACNSTMSNGAFPASGAVLGTNGSGGLALIAWNASAPIKFLTGGYENANEWLRIDASGNFIASNVVTSAPGASLNNGQYQFCVYDNGSAPVFEVRYKNASGTVKVGAITLS